MRSGPWIAAVLAGVWFNSAAGAAEPAPGEYRVGVAKADVTPRHPVRLNGFGFRRTESEGVTQRIWAKALAIDDGRGGPALLIAADVLGIPADVRDELARRFAKKVGLRPERLALTATHTHTAPMLSGANPTIFGTPIPPEHLANIDRYTRFFLDRLEEAGLAALKDLKPAKLSWGVGKVTFAKNRRRQPGPVDHDLPVLAVRDPGGKVRAVWVSYACHCVTLSHNKISGDWAGYAQEAIQDAHPDSVALVSIGCGADANPDSGVTGDKVEVAARQGMQIAEEVKRLLGGYLAPVTGPLTTKIGRVELPLAPLPSREDWEAKAKRDDAIGHHARVQLAKLDRGEKLMTRIDYPIQTWAFGESLGLVFLPGEVVADYSVRLKKEFDRGRLWVNAYANNNPCYIPSERVLKEGGYEGGGAMIYYDVPVPFAPGLEDRIIKEVHDQLGKTFAPPFDPAKVPQQPPRSPQQSRGEIRVKPGFVVDLVAAEPLVVDPVAIDFGPDGSLWVAEMHDYPSGRGGKFEAGGRVRLLTDDDGDGVFDRSTVFLDGIPFPTGVTVWRKGVLVCAAPDILYAEDRDGDGKADVVEKLYSGFGTENYQARVNSLVYGLDGWVYGSCGLFGGSIRSHRTGTVLELGHRDFRIRPDTGEIEPATGRTQQGRPRDDWGDWFGCDNSNPIRHYALEDHYLRRNPHAVPPNPTVYAAEGPDGRRVYPARGDLQLFELSGPAGLFTAGCGLEIYRDDRLGREFAGNAFVCEPVNLVVHRLCLTPRGATFSARRAPDEAKSEFLASTDNWFRPVQAKTGPDGALWVADMYRYLIEHPRWIPPHELEKVDPRAGASMGRIYRVRRADASPHPIPRLDRLDTAGLVAALDSPNGWQRDMAQQMLLWNNDRSAVPLLEKLFRESARPQARLHALCTLDGLGALAPELVLRAMGDEHPALRRHAARLAEPFLPESRRGEPGGSLGEALLKLITDPDAKVRQQAAYSLGEWTDPRAGEALGRFAVREQGDRFLAAAALSSVNAGNAGAVVRAALAEAKGELPPGLLANLARTAVGVDNPQAMALLLKAVGSSKRKFAALAAVLDALDARGTSLSRLKEAGGEVGEAAERLSEMFEAARKLAADPRAPPKDRARALTLVGRGPAGEREGDADLLAGLFTPNTPPELQQAAAAALGRIRGSRPAELLLARWEEYSPALRAAAADALLGRRDGANILLDAIERKQISAAGLDAARRQRLLQHPNRKVRERAEKLFAAAVNPDRQAVIDAYRAGLARRGDAARGKELFAKHCAACHQLAGEGNAIGPDIAPFAGKPSEEILIAVMDPNRAVDPRYFQYRAETRAGRLLTGVVTAETATSVTLADADGKPQTILREELESLSATGVSGMPEGLEKDLSPPELADLIAYVRAAARRAHRRRRPVQGERGV